MLRPSYRSLQGSQYSGKTYKMRGKFQKFEKSGEILNTQGNFLENLSTQGKLRENYKTSVQLVDTITLCGS